MAAPAQALSAITISKVRTGVASIAAGTPQATEFTITVSNSSAVPLPAFFVDRMDPGLVIGDITVSSPFAECQKRDQSDTDFWCLLAVPRYGQISVTVTATASASTREGVYENCAGLATIPLGTPPQWPLPVCDPLLDSEMPEVTAAVEVVNDADLEVTATTSPTTINPGDTTTVTVGITNKGPSDATTPVTVTSALPPGVSLVSGDAPWSCSEAGQDLTCTWDAGPPPGLQQAQAALLPVGDSTPDLVLTLSTAKPATVGFYDVAFTGSSMTPDTSSTSNTATARILVTPVDLAIAKQGAGTFQTNTEATWNLTVSNVGTISDAATVTVSDTLPAGMEFVSASGQGWACAADGQVVTCTKSGLQVAASDQIAIVGKVTKGQAQFVNEATVSTRSFEQNTANNSTRATADTTPVDLAITKTAVASPVTIGAQGSWLLTVSNAGTISDNGLITVSDSLPVGQQYVSAQADGWVCEAAGRQLTCTHGVLAAATTTSITVTTNVTGGAPSASNEATVATTSYEQNTDNNKATASMGIRREPQTAKPLPKTPRRVKSGRTDQGQKLRTRVMCLPLKRSVAGEASYCKVTRAKGYVKVRVIGPNPMRVRIVQTAKGTKKFKPFRQARTYIVRP
jgi:uncharacterized repeat protein (TIGR01451 family)